MRHLLYDRARRKFVPVIAGGSGEPPPNDGGEGKSDPPPAKEEGKDEPKTFTQEQVSAIAAKEKDQGKRAAEQAVQEQLGVSIEEAAEIVKAAREREEAEKTEAQKARDAAEAERAKADEEKAKAARERHQVKLERHIILSGVTPTEENETRIERIARLVDVEEGATDDEVSQAVTTLKEEMPELFGVSAGEGGKAPSSDPGSQPKDKKAEEDAFKRGQERAKARTASQGYDILEPSS